jgi:hypothetical protein
MRDKFYITTGIIAIIFLITSNFRIEAASFGDCLNCPPPAFLRDKIDISYFYYENDPECSKTSISLKALVANYPYFELAERDMSNPKVKELREMLDEVYLKDKSQFGKVPAVLIGKELFIGYKEIKENLLSLLQSTLKERQGDAKSLNDRIGLFFKKMKFFIVPALGEHLFPIVLVSGLIDGINPCSLTLLIFLISFLSVTKKIKRDILSIGSGFTIGTFVVYFGIGVGLFHIVSSMVFASMLRWFYLILGIILLIFGVLSLVDIYYIKRDEESRVKLQLPRRFKIETHNIIRFYTTHSGDFKFITGAVIGSLTSFIEFACTGQIYLPVVSLIKDQVKSQFLLYLFSYNIMFIVPLLVLVMASSFWVSSKQVNNFLLKNLVFTKTLTAILFFILAIYMLSIL